MVNHLFGTLIWKTVSVINRWALLIWAMMWMKLMPMSQLFPEDCQESPWRNYLVMWYWMKSRQLRGSVVQFVCRCLVYGIFELISKVIDLSFYHFWLAMMIGRTLKLGSLQEVCPSATTLFTWCVWTSGSLGMVPVLFADGMYRYFIM